ncbi:hypothetical protein [Catenuloplanes atrovinosus]|uniref:Uncharacterized protein n=1 Tax=Catenuloplanes atrovinosus TaxID=137266 RepID=A0AAE3YUJ2_9ACTN|nr:hypothetical protein [Catenuloplanes atrovinosus]MDR7279442.1 hypothetical protein [Catenuloplanes atrovinosus]
MDDPGQRGETPERSGGHRMVPDRLGPPAFAGPEAPAGRRPAREPGASGSHALPEPTTPPRRAAAEAASEPAPGSRTAFPPRADQRRHTDTGHPDADPARRAATGPGRRDTDAGRHDTDTGGLGRRRAADAPGHRPAAGTDPAAAGMPPAWSTPPSRPVPPGPVSEAPPGAGRPPTARGADTAARAAMPDRSGIVRGGAAVPEPDTGGLAARGRIPGPAAAGGPPAGHDTGPGRGDTPPPPMRGPDRQGHDPRGRFSSAHDRDPSGDVMAPRDRGPWSSPPADAGQQGADPRRGGGRAAIPAQVPHETAGPPSARAAATPPAGDARTPGARDHGPARPPQGPAGRVPSGTGPSGGNPTVSGGASAAVPARGGAQVPGNAPVSGGAAIPPARGGAQVPGTAPVSGGAAVPPGRGGAQVPGRAQQPGRASAAVRRQGPPPARPDTSGAIPLGPESSGGHRTGPDASGALRLSPDTSGVYRPDRQPGSAAGQRHPDASGAHRTGNPPVAAQRHPGPDDAPGPRTAAARVTPPDAAGHGAGAAGTSLAQRPPSTVARITPAPAVPSQPEAPEAETDRAAPAEARQKPWQVLVGVLAALVLVGVCGLSSFFILADEQSGRDAQASGGNPEATAQARDISSRGVDGEPLTTNEVFPAGTIAITSQEPPYTVLKTEQLDDCGKAAAGEIPQLLKDLGCNQVVRGTMRSPDSGYLVTAGVFNLEDETGAKWAHEQIKAMVDGQKGRFSGMRAGAGTEPVEESSAQVGWNIRGHFLAYCVIARADGEKIIDGDPQARQILYDMVELHLRNGVLEKRATQPTTS